MFQAGDVVLCKFPFQEDPTIFKLRPALVLSDLGNHEYKLAQITHTNRSSQLVGVWVTKNSSAGVSMGIRSDSFINLSHTVDINRIAISRLIGTYPDMDEIEDLCKKNSIPLI